jgi:hypothetical protein
MTGSTARVLSMPSVTLRRGSKITLSQLNSYSMNLPSGWENFYSVRRYGRHLGTPVVCAFCHRKATVIARDDGKVVRPHARWKFLAMHQLKCRRRNAAA